MGAVGTKVSRAICPSSPKAAPHPAMEWDRPEARAGGTDARHSSSNVTIAPSSRILLKTL